MPTRIFKPLVYWAQTEGERRPRTIRAQIDTGADRTILPSMPPGGTIVGSSKINGRSVDLVNIVAFIPDTSCTALIEAAVPRKRGSLPVVIGSDFFQEARAVLDYRGHVIGCPGGAAHRKGFAGGRRRPYVSRAILAEVVHGVRVIAGTEWPIVYQLVRDERTGGRPFWQIVDALVNGVPDGVTFYDTRRAATRAWLGRFAVQDRGLSR